MTMNPITTTDASQTYRALSTQKSFSPPVGDEDAVKEAFTDFIGQSLFGQMMSAMRETVKQPAYFGGGQAEKIFQQQMDQTLVENITEASADRIAEPMYELFRMNRRS